MGKCYDIDHEKERLIAAAPALLKAARFALESLDAIDVPQEWDCRQLLRAAIAQAEGGTERECCCPQVWSGHGEPQPDPRRVDVDCSVHGIAAAEGK